METDDIKPDMDTLLGGPLGPGRGIALSDGTMLFVPENVQLTAEEISALHHPCMENDARNADFANSLIIEGVKSPELWITLEELADLKGKQIKDLTIAELSITTWHEACDL